MIFQRDMSLFAAFMSLAFLAFALILLLWILASSLLNVGWNRRYQFSRASRVSLYFSLYCYLVSMFIKFSDKFSLFSSFVIAAGLVSFFLWVIITTLREG